jgi:gamma-glutamyltranspeptidase/glutathione hydrolase
VQELLETEWTTSAAVYLDGGRPPAPGALLRNPVLADTWRRLIAESAGGSREAEIDAARRVWREGFVAEALAAFAARPTMDTSGERRAGFLTTDDIAGFEATYEEPATFTWNGWTVAKPGLWSQGPVFLQQLALLPDSLDYATSDYVHTLVEGTKLAMADREAWYGDLGDVTLDALLAPAYSNARRDLVGGTASYELRPGSPDGRAPRLPAAHADPVPATAGAGEPTVAVDGGTRGDTCHVDVVDRWGNMISATPSGGWLQSNPVVPELGFPLGTRLQMAWLEPGLPNSLTPGKRPRTTLSPSLALRDGEPVLAFGTPGGDQQDQWTLHFLLAVALRDEVRGGPDLQGAIDAPNWHTDSFPSSFYPRGTAPGSLVVESRIGEETITDLRRRGHDVTVGAPWSEGRICAVARDPATGVLSAGANPRGMQGYAVGR